MTTDDREKRLEEMERLRKDCAETGPCSCMTIQCDTCWLLSELREARDARRLTPEEAERVEEIVARRRECCVMAGTANATLVLRDVPWLIERLTGKGGEGEERRHR